MNLKEEIINNWETDIIGYAQSIKSLTEVGYPCWTVKYHDSYGVAIPYSGEEGINESFSNARIRSDVINVTEKCNSSVILLTADYSVAKEPFSSLCEEMIIPGEDGKNRERISLHPVVWWQEWKELLGNKDIDERIYDVLGELCALRYFVSLGKEADWGGPNSATYDIELEDEFIEVKSTTSRSKKEITISSQFQLDPPEKDLYLVFCQFEQSSINGVSINSVVSDLIDLGIDYDYLNSRLLKKGIEENTSIRKCTFILHDMLKYNIDNNFPRIAPSSFIGGVVPVGITKITYTVDLDGLESTSLLQRNDYEIQND